MRLNHVIKVFICILIVITTFFTGIIFAFAAEGPTSTTAVEKAQAIDKKVLTNFLYNYLLNRYKSLGNLSDDISYIDNYFIKSEELYGSEYQKALISTMIEHNKLQVSDLHFSNLSLSVVIDSMQVKDNIVNVNYHIKAKYKYFCMNDFTVESDNYQQAEIIYSNEIRLKTIKMLDDQNADIFDNVISINSDISNQYSLDSNNSTIYKFAKQKILSSSREDALSVKTAIMSAIRVEPNVSINAISKSYNRTAAVKYALTYAEKCNPVYESGSSPECTNYVSQCLRAGGLPQDKNGSTDQKWFFDSFGVSSYSWKNAHGLYVYLTTNNGNTSNAGVKKITPYTTRASILSNLSTGDVVQYFNEAGGTRASHSTIVTNILYSTSGYRTDLVLCQHSYSPNKNALFSTNLSKIKVTGEHIATYYK